MFKLFINGVAADVNPDETIELKKGSVISEKSGTLNLEVSTNIKLPATEKNIGIFNAHILLGGSSEILGGVAHFGLQAFACLVQLSEITDTDITVYFISNTKRVDEFLKTPIVDLVNEKYPNELIIRGDWGDINIHLFKAIMNHFKEEFSVPVATPKIGEAVTAAGFDDVINPVEVSELLDEIYLRLNLRKTSKKHLQIIYKDNHDPLHFADVAVTYSINLWDSSSLFSTFYSGGITYASMMEVFGDREVTYRFACKTSQSVDLDGLVLVIKKDGIPIKTQRFDAIYSNIFNGYIFSHTFTIFEKTASYSFAIKYKFIASNPFNLPEFCSMLFLRNNLEAGIDYPTGAVSILEALSTQTVGDVLKSLAFENAKYLSVKSNKISIKPFPSLDDLEIVNMENFYRGVKKINVGDVGLLKAKNNAVTYPDPEQYHLGINIVNDNETLSFLLKENADFKKLKHSRVGVAGSEDFFVSENEQITPFVGAARLRDNIEKFRIFKDVGDTGRVYSIELKGVSEVPEKIMYIPQLNGLFLAKRIVRTNKESIFVDCYKIEKKYDATIK